MQSHTLEGTVNLHLTVSTNISEEGGTIQNKAF